jgi:hypothetical protein
MVRQTPGGQNGKQENCSNITRRAAHAVGSSDWGGSLQNQLLTVTQFSTRDGTVRKPKAKSWNTGKGIHVRAK